MTGTVANGKGIIENPIRLNLTLQDSIQGFDRVIHKRAKIYLSQGQLNKYPLDSVKALFHIRRRQEQQIGPSQSRVHKINGATPSPSLEDKPCLMIKFHGLFIGGKSLSKDCIKQFQFNIE